MFYNAFHNHEEVKTEEIKMNFLCTRYIYVIKLLSTFHGVVDRNLILKKRFTRYSVFINLPKKQNSSKLNHYLLK